MALQQNIPDLIAFAGDDWVIPWQLTPSGDITGWVIVFSVIDPRTGNVVFSETAATSGPGVTLSTGATTFTCPNASTILLAPLITNKTMPTNFSYNVEATVSSIKTRYDIGVIPVRM